MRRRSSVVAAADGWQPSLATRASFQAPGLLFLRTTVLDEKKR